jgi:hypothetical protein
LYVGDDANDETAFALRGNVVAVRVGHSRVSEARYYLRAQTEIDELLRLLCALRRSGPDETEPGRTARPVRTPASGSMSRRPRGCST